MENAYNPLPGIETYNEAFNPTLTSRNSTYDIQFYLTKEVLNDVDTYKSFIKNCEKRVRNSVTYSHYKGFLMGLGMDHCQVLGYINGEMATIEMHHAIFTLFDICFMVTEHLLNTVGYVTTFDVVQIVKDEHKLHHVAVTMLAKTPHQMYHNTDDLFIHPNMCMGDWVTLMNKYITGISQDLAVKLLYYLNRAIDIGAGEDSGILQLRDKILDWSAYNV